MRPYSGAINVQNVYEACIPYALSYPYRVIKKDKVEINLELFSDKDKEREIEIATMYKLRPIIVMSSSEVDNSYLAVSITKIKEKITKIYS